MAPEQSIIDVSKLVGPRPEHYNQESAAAESAERHGVLPPPLLPTPIEAAREANAYLEEAYSRRKSRKTKK